MTSSYKRWYDHDPALLELLEVLKFYQDELKEQARVFLEKLESQVSKETIDNYYNMVKPLDGKRWYDQDPVISKTVELLRIVPPSMQKKVATKFLSALETMGLDIEAVKNK